MSRMKNLRMIFSSNKKSVERECKGRRRSGSVNCVKALRNNRGELVCREAAVSARWFQFFRDLYGMNVLPACQLSARCLQRTELFSLHAGGKNKWKPRWSCNKDELGGVEEWKIMPYKRYNRICMANLPGT